MRGRTAGSERKALSSSGGIGGDHFLVGFSKKLCKLVVMFLNCGLPNIRPSLRTF